MRRVMVRYTVGLKKGTRSKALTVEGEDALMAALSAKLDNPACETARSGPRMQGYLVNALCKP